LITTEEDKKDVIQKPFLMSDIAERLVSNDKGYENFVDKVTARALDDTLSEADVSSDYKQVARQTKITLDKKDASFHALLSSSLLKRLKEESERTGLSMNEIVCQALLNKLKNPD
jgi:predicted DNA binding CopG/RHH family protein